MKNFTHKIICLVTMGWLALAPSLLMGIAIFINIGDLSRVAAIVIGAVYMLVAVILGALVVKGEKK